MSHFFPILIVFCMIFVSCATAPERKTEEKKEKPVHVESEYGIRVTPESVEIYEVRKVEDEDFDKLFAEANRLFDENKLDEAERLYTRIAEMNPEHALAPSCRYNAGLIAIRLKNWEEAEKNFFSAYRTMQKPEDKRDALLNWLEAARNAEIWEKISEISGKIIGNFPAHSEFKESDRREISLRYAESLIMTGKIEEGRRLADYWRMTILRETPHREAVYIPELALAYFVLGRSFVKEFQELPLGDSTESLEEKCRKIVEAQTQFLKAINVGVIFWTNASAFEAAKLYTDLYAEMEAKPVPEDLSDEEKPVYTCELWKKISILLRKSRKTLVKSTEAAKKIGEENEYTEKSFKMVEEIDRIYEEKENICRN